MKKIHILLLSMLAGLPCACQKDDCPAPDKDKYIYDIPQTDLAAPAVVGAYYTNITSSSSWLKSGKKIYSGTPVLGEYLSTNKEVLAQQLQWADEAGLDFLILTWDAASADKTLVKNFQSVRAQVGANVKMVINYNTKHLKVTNDSPLQDPANLAKMVDDFTTSLAPLFAGQDYYKLGDRPVVLITPANLSSSAKTSIDYSQVIPPVKEAMSALGHNLYTIGEFTTGWVAPVNYEKQQIASFDGVTANDWSTNMYDRYYAFFSFLDLNWTNWKNTIAQWNTDFIPCVFPSYNDRMNSTSSYKYTFGQEGNTAEYTTFCNVAKRNIGSQNIVLINSWNNYQKGTNLEPSQENGAKFLEITRTQFKK